MAKRGRGPRRDNRNPKRRSRHEHLDEPQDMDDEIDAFHKQRDIIPLDVNGDAGESSEDEENPVFDDKDINNDDEDEDDEDEYNDDYETDAQDSRMASKIARQQKFLRSKFGEFDNEMSDDEEQDEEGKKFVWGGKTHQYYNADNDDFELQSSDDEAPKEEEAEVLRLQKEKAKSLSMEDFGLEDTHEDESDRELTLEEVFVNRKASVKSPFSKEDVNMDAAFEEVKKDLNALSKEEQMDFVFSSAPELVGLLSELNDALEQLENRVNPLLDQVKNGGVILEGGMRYLEVMQLLLLSYCQAITFYLLLKSEGQPVRDHPVIARLVEIKGLLDKMKQLDGNLSSELEEILNKNCWSGTVEKSATRNASPVLVSDSITKHHTTSLVLSNTGESPESDNKNQMVTGESLKDHDSTEGENRHKKDEVSVRSMEMLKLRAVLEEKLKQKGVFTSFAPKSSKVQKHPKEVNRHLETYDDFNDEAVSFENGSNAHTGSFSSTKLSHLVTAKPNKPKVISGDDDLPKRDDIGERRRKHELRVLAGAGIKADGDDENEVGNSTADEASDTEEGDDTGGSEDDFYEQVKQKRNARLAAKAEIYTRFLAFYWLHQFTFLLMSEHFSQPFSCSL
uniref:Something about silencing protein 10 n=1 Tax=Rhizophora mucronata TaxID=61149 RepID=A0A2P2KXH3_RHIMU